MAKYTQKTIEKFFEEYKIKKADDKAKLLPILTNVIYDHNIAVVKYEQEQDDFKKKQLETEIAEILDKIKEIFEDEL